MYGPGARYHAPPEGADERLPLRALPEREHYARSKRESESLALTAHREGRVWATALRPCVIYGERDRHFVPRAARLFRSGVAPVIGGGRSILAIVHAANVAHAAVLALATERAGGEAYNVTNDGDLSVAEFVRHAADGLGKRVRLVDIPLSVARGGMYAAKAGLALVRGGNAASMASAAVDFLSRDNPFVSRKLVEQLGWAPVVNPRTGVRDTFRWYREETEKLRARQWPRPQLAS